MGTILQEILSEPPSADTIIKFDELSNALCLVADSLSVISGTMYNISSILNVVHPIIYITSRNPQQCCGDHLILKGMPFQSVQCHYLYTKPYCNWIDWPSL